MTPTSSGSTRPGRARRPSRPTRAALLFCATRRNYAHASTLKLRQDHPAELVDRPAVVLTLEDPDLTRRRTFGLGHDREIPTAVRGGLDSHPVYAGNVFTRHGASELAHDFRIAFQRLS